MVVLASFISPYEKDRDNIKKLIPEGEFIEIFVDAKLDTLKKRDPKGLYKKALSGQIPNFTGINSDYEVPKKPDITIDTDTLSPNESMNKILNYLKDKNVIGD